MNTCHVVDDLLTVSCLRVHVLPFEQNSYHLFLRKGGFSYYSNTNSAAILTLFVSMVPTPSREEIRSHAQSSCDFVPILDPRALLFCACRTTRRALGNPGTDSFVYSLFVETMKTPLIGQSLAR